MQQSETPIVEARDLWFHYGDKTPVLKGVDLSITAGQWLALLGCNGSGKSTLVKHFNGLLRPYRGELLLDGQDITRKQVGELARIVSYLPQNPDRLIFADSVRKEIAFGPSRQDIPGESVKERVDQAMRLLGLSELAEVPPATLGYGLRRKVALASVLALRPRLLILDEPTNGLDAGFTRHVMEVVESLHQEGATILIITHDLALAARYARRIAVMQDGQIVVQGDTRSILSNGGMLAQAGLMSLPVTRLAAQLSADVLPGLPADLLTPEEFVDAFTAARKLETGSAATSEIAP